MGTRDLGDEIWSRIGRVSSVESVVGVGGTRFPQQIVGNVVMRGECALRVFHGERDRHLVAEILGQTNSVLACKAEADVILSVDGLRTRVVGSASIVAGTNSNFVFGHQAPSLAAQELPAIVKLGLSPHLPQAEGVAVGLSVVGRGTGRQEVTRYV